MERIDRNDLRALVAAILSLTYKDEPRRVAIAAAAFAELIIRAAEDSDASTQIRQENP